MPLHRDIHWLGRQWAVTGHGLQLINQKQMGYYDIEVARLWEPGVIEAMQSKAWINRPDFDKAVEIARGKFADTVPADFQPPIAPATAPPPRAVPQTTRAPAALPSGPSLEELLAKLKARSAVAAQPADAPIATPEAELSETSSEFAKSEPDLAKPVRAAPELAEPANSELRQAAQPRPKPVRSEPAEPALVEAKAAEPEPAEPKLDLRVAPQAQPAPPRSEPSKSESQSSESQTSEPQKPAPRSEPQKSPGVALRPIALAELKPAKPALPAAEPPKAEPLKPEQREAAPATAAPRQPVPIPIRIVRPSSGPPRPVLPVFSRKIAGSARFVRPWRARWNAASPGLPPRL
jgi:hypothetical protein